MNVYSAAADLLDPPAPEGAQRWRDVRRPSQVPPFEEFPDWFIWMIKAGRGFGKTRTGAETLLDLMELGGPGTFWALCGPTYDDIRDIMVEGESGMQTCARARGARFEWNRSLGQGFVNGARFDAFTAEKPDSWRGPNLNGAWCDEPASWGGKSNPWKKANEAWGNLMLMCRKGTPRIIVTGTPKPTKFIRHLMAEAVLRGKLTEGSTRENLSNLSEVYRRNVIEPLSGTILGQQELEAKLLDRTPGALWIPAQLEQARLVAPKQLQRVVVAVDPSVTSGEDSDECGIVVAGRNGSHGWVLDDRSCVAAPRTWAGRAIAAYHDYGADALVAEVNNGGDMVKTIVRQIDPSVNVKMVWASRGKVTRAEPVAALYGDPAKPRSWASATLHHDHTRADLSILEDQMTTWVQGDPDSPDRMDAAVWAVTELFGLGSKNARQTIYFEED